MLKIDTLDLKINMIYQMWVESTEVGVGKDLSQGHWDHEGFKGDKK